MSGTVSELSGPALVADQTLVVVRMVLLRPGVQGAEGLAVVHRGAGTGLADAVDQPGETLVAFAAEVRGAGQPGREGEQVAHVVRGGGGDPPDPAVRFAERPVRAEHGPRGLLRGQHGEP